MCFSVDYSSVVVEEVHKSFEASEEESVSVCSQHGLEMHIHLLVELS
jgi:hypothetical protein